MKKTFLTLILLAGIKLLTFGSSPIDFNSSNDSLKKETNNSALKVVGTDVYKDNVFLNEDKVINILNPHPEILMTYEKGKSLRSTGTFLLVGGIVMATGGIALMVNGIEPSKSTYYGSSSTPTYNDNYFLGLLVGTVGELMVAGGIVCRVVGKGKIRRAIYNYNNSSSSSQYAPNEINYQFGLLDNGNVGMKLTF